MSKTLPSGSARVVQRVPYSSKSPIRVAPRCDRPLHRGRLVGADQVQVQPVLARAWLGHGQEHQGRDAAVRGRRDDGEVLVGAVDQRAVEQPAPESGEAGGVGGVDDDLAEAEVRWSWVAVLLQCQVGVIGQHTSVR